MSIQSAIAVLKQRLRKLQSEGMWGFQVGHFVEPACLALLALHEQPVGELRPNLRRLADLQSDDGSWPAFVGDTEACWVTALAVLTLMAFSEEPARLRRAGDWLVASKGRESHWLWRWKFRAIDKNVEFDASKYGWNWIPGTTSWVVPTSFSLLALTQMIRADILDGSEVQTRIETGREMLLDRMCPGGGWNAGNKAAFGVPYTPYVDATAAALLALAAHGERTEIRNSLAWLERQITRCASAFGVAWGILALTAHHPEAASRPALAQLIGSLFRSATDVASMDEIATIALTALALQAAEGNNIFKVQA